jgi:hypothetical protein
MMQRCVLTLAFLLHVSLCFSAQLTPILDDKGIGVTIDATAWPQSLRKDLVSGLTNRLLIRVSLLSGTQVVQQRAVEIAIRYDLWDERFAMSLMLDGIETQTRTIQNMDEMRTILQKLRLPGLFSVTKDVTAQSHTITTEVLLNPIDRERMEMIRKWVADNSVGPTDIGAHTSRGEWGMAIFNRIFEQYAQGADIAAVWRESSTSGPFLIEDRTHESR